MSNRHISTIDLDRLDRDLAAGQDTGWILTAVVADTGVTLPALGADDFGGPAAAWATGTVPAAEVDSGLGLGDLGCEKGGQWGWHIGLQVGNRLSAHVINLASEYSFRSQSYLNSVCSGFHFLFPIGPAD